MSREKALAGARHAVADVLREKGCVTIVDVFVVAAIGREVRAACEAMGLGVTLGSC